MSYWGCDNPRQHQREAERDALYGRPDRLWEHERQVDFMNDNCHAAYVDAYRDEARRIEMQEEERRQEEEEERRQAQQREWMRQQQQEEYEQMEAEEEERRAQEAEEEMQVASAEAEAQANAEVSE